MFRCAPLCAPLALAGLAWAAVSAPAGDCRAARPVPAASTCAATIVVYLPADARLLVDGRPTTSTGETRRFVSPALPSGRTYTYTLTAVLPDERTVHRQVQVRAGGTSRVDFTAPEQVVVAPRPPRDRFADELGNLPDPAADVPLLPEFKP